MIAMNASGVGLVGFVVFATACFSPSYNEVRCDRSGECPDGLTCDVDGMCRSDVLAIDAQAIDAEVADAAPLDAALVDASIDSPLMDCTCIADTLTCSGGVVPCASGCVGEVDGRCRVLQPSNGVLADLATGAGANLTMPSARVYVFDTDDGSITSYDTAEQNPMAVRAGGTGVVSGIAFEARAQSGTDVELAMWGLTSLTQPAGSGKIAFRGSRAAALVASGPIELHGFIDASGGQTDDGTLCPQCAGPGGGAGATTTTPAGGCAPGGDGNYSSTAWKTGGAGGGMSSQGSSGGASLIAGGAPGPIASCSPAALEPLAGGGGGGRASMNGGAGGDAVGGGGGGALQLTSLERITVEGTAAEVYVGGIGGGGSVGMWGGGGGGAGGGILLEAPAVTVGGGAAVIANGGGGGAGRTSNAGQIGQSTATRAAGGAGDGAAGNTGRGGFGGITTDAGDAAGRSTSGSGGSDGTGGGGGAAGRIRINTAEGRTPTLAGAVVSPPASIGTRPAL